MDSAGQASAATTQAPDANEIANDFKKARAGEHPRSAGTCEVGLPFIRDSIVKPEYSHKASASAPGRYAWSRRRHDPQTDLGHGMSLKTSLEYPLSLLDESKAVTAKKYRVPVASPVTVNAVTLPTFNPSPGACK